MEQFRESSKSYTGLTDFRYIYDIPSGGYGEFNTAPQGNAYLFTGEFIIGSQGEAYLSTAAENNDGKMSIVKIIDQDVMDDLEAIILDQEIYLRNTESVYDEDVTDGCSEYFQANFTNGRIEFSYYGAEDRKNDVLRNYLLNLAGVTPAT